MSRILSETRIVRYGRSFFVDRGRSIDRLDEVFAVHSVIEVFVV